MSITRYLSVRRLRRYLKSFHNHEWPARLHRSPSIVNDTRGTGEPISMMPRGIEPRAGAVPHSAFSIEVISRDRTAGGRGASQCNPIEGTSEAIWLLFNPRSITILPEAFAEGKRYSSEPVGVFLEFPKIDIYIYMAGRAPKLSRSEPGCAPHIEEGEARRVFGGSQKSFHIGKGCFEPGLYLLSSVDRS
jgi:hypothetical protein